jgi:hypothetical protein
METNERALSQDEAVDMLRSHPALLITPEGDPVLLGIPALIGTRAYSVLAVLARALAEDAPELTELINRYSAQYRAECAPHGETLQ